ncbi:MAG TPA: diguanylate cyclase, partial [Dehalococcoidia bacterium]|nr:diguanylate cyclase [Dehalococcoidia bacterium]
VFAAADLGFTYLTLQEVYLSGNPIDLGWPLGLLLIGYATVRRWRYGPLAVPASDEASRERAALMDKVLSFGPYLLVGLAMTLLFVAGFGERESERNVFIGLALSVIVLVLLRQFVTLVENQRLAGTLRSFNEILEATVEERTAKLANLQSTASALATAASAEEVCQVGLGAIRTAAPAQSAALYIRKYDAVERVAGDDVPGVSRLVAMLDGNSRATVQASVDGAEGVHVALLPFRTGGQTEGVVVARVETSSLDLGHLAALASELGVAYENQIQLQEAKRLAERDPVTEVFNHRYLHTRLNALLDEAQAQGNPLSLVLADIDDFKLFNDTYGHQTGDEVLRMVARGLKELAPADAVIARFGGDEFAVILADAGESDVIAFCEGVQEWMGQRAFEQPGSERIPVALTFGYATFPEHGKRRYELVAAADSRLYEAKRSGTPLPSKQPAARLETPGSFMFLDALITSVDNKDRYTKRHCDLVAEYAVMLAEEMKLSQGVQRSLSIAGALHDVGKICIPDRILRKPGPLDDEEYDIIKLHVPLAANLIQHVPQRREVLDGVLNHHERWDGKGYPKGTSGTNIPLVGRIMAVADAFSAMTLDRPYRQALPFEVAIGELRKHRGTQFDGDLVDIFVTAFERRIGNHRHSAA